MINLEVEAFDALRYGALSFRDTAKAVVSRANAR